MIHGGNVWQGNSPAQWLDYSANIRPEGAPDWVKDALMGAMDKLSYYPDQEMKRARQSLSAYLDLPAEYVCPRQAESRRLIWRRTFPARGCCSSRHALRSILCSAKTGERPSAIFRF